MVGCITVHFHPGWPHGDGTVVEAIARDGAYRSQWVTGTSNGGLTAVPGGQRWLWESRLFAGRYDAADPVERPVCTAPGTGTTTPMEARPGSGRRTSA